MHVVALSRFMFEADLTQFAPGNIPVIEALLDCRATLDQRDSSGATPLHFAAMNAKVDVVKLLLDRGAKPSKLRVWWEVGHVIFPPLDHLHKILPSKFHSLPETSPSLWFWIFLLAKNRRC